MFNLSPKKTRTGHALRLGLIIILLALFAVSCQGDGADDGEVGEPPATEPADVEEPAPVEEEEPAPVEEEEPEPVEEEEAAGVGGTLNILGFGQPDEVATVRVDQFTQQYPEVELNAPEGGLDQQQFLTAVASGNPPDLIYTNRQTLSSYATRGAIMPMDECINSMDIDMSMYHPAAVEEVTIDGTIYGIPEFFNIVLVLIDDDVLAETGLTVDDIDTSDWDKIAEVNEQMTAFEDSGRLSRIGFDPKLPEFFPLWVRANGGQIISEDGRTAMLNTPEAIEALEFTVGLHEAAGGRQDFIAFRDTWDFFGGNNMFVADQLGAFPMEQWYLNVLAEVSPDTDISSKPFQDREGNPISFATGNAWAIPVGSSNPEAACAFARTMTATESWVAAAEERLRLREESGQPPAGVYSGNLEANEIIFGELLQTTGNPDMDDALAVVLEVQEHAFATPASAAGAEVQQAWVDAVNRVLNGEQGAEEALNQAQQEAQAALDEGWAARE